MKKYMTPEFEEVKYEVKDCLKDSGNPAAGENDGKTYPEIPEWP